MFIFLFFCDLQFFSLGDVKGLVYVPPLPSNLEKRRQKITNALQTVTQNILQRVWEELEYRIDVCHVSGGALVEQLCNRL